MNRSEAQAFADHSQLSMVFLSALPFMGYKSPEQKVCSLVRIGKVSGDSQSRKCSFLSMQWFYSCKELKYGQRIHRCVLRAEVLGGRWWEAVQENVGTPTAQRCWIYWRPGTASGSLPGGSHSLCG